MADLFPVSANWAGQRLEIDAHQHDRFAQLWLMGDEREKKFGKGVNRQVESESSALTRLAYRPNAAAVQVYQFSCDVQTQAEARAVAVNRIRVLIQAFKNQREGFGRNTTASV